MEITHRVVETNGLRMHLAEAGHGPLVILCHGFPESWYSWRRQITALAEAGYHVVAPDQRGYGQTTAPERIDEYTLLHLVGDMVGLVGAVSDKTAVIVGHDWGAPVAWHAALMRPDVFRGVVGLSVPYRPRGGVRPTSVMAQTPDAIFYQLYFQEPGVAEADLERDPKATIRRVLYWASGEARDPARGSVGSGDVGMVPRATGLVNSRPDPDPGSLPAWLGPEEIDFYAGEFARAGFRGGLNWYRNIDRNWELTAPWQDAQIHQRSLFIAGAKDPVITGLLGGKRVAEMKRVLPNLKEKLIIEGAGHRIQQERPEEVNAALIRFLKETAAEPTARADQYRPRPNKTSFGPRGLMGA
jgi:pimeloyl-ACP methyl ester carboxylesterase